MHHVPDKSCKNVSLLTMQKADVKAIIAIIEQQLARLVFSTKPPKLIKLYGKIIKILIFSQSFIKNDYFCGIKDKNYGKKSDG